MHVYLYFHVLHILANVHLLYYSHFNYQDFNENI
jgi:hypothetical protein